MNKFQVITACVFLHKDGKLFLPKRSENKNLFPNEYEMPGGHIEFAETIEEGLKRETREELHIEINLGDPFFVFTYLSPDHTKHIVDINFFATMKDPNQEIKLNSEDHSEYTWISENEIDDFFLPNNQEAQTARKGFALLHSKTMNFGY